MGVPPFDGLDDPAVADVFRQIIERRYDVRVLAEHYQLGTVPPYLTHEGRRVTVAGYAGEILAFLLQHTGGEPLRVARLFQSQFPNMARPPELAGIFSKYMQMKAAAFDIDVIADVLIPQSVIGDIGAGRGELGQAILQFSDRHGLSIQRVVGTDLHNWHQMSTDSRLEFHAQSSGVDVPLPSASLDTIVVKWVLHHMPSADQVEFLKAMHRVLKPGSQLIVIEALGTSGMESELAAQLELEMQNPVTWPEGSFREADAKLSRAFMRLGHRQQMQVNALEDYFGHNLIMGRDWMPQPFAYDTVEGWRQKLEFAGLAEVHGKRRVLGSAPTMRMGPPTVRMVAQKS